MQLRRSSVFICVHLWLIFSCGCSRRSTTAHQLGFVANSEDNTVTVFSLDHMKTAATVAVGREPVALAAGKGRVWVVCRGDGLLQAIGTKTLRVAVSVRVGREPFAILRHGARAWVLNRGSRSATEVDLESARVTGTITLDGTPSGAALSPDGRVLAISLPERKEVEFANTAGFNVTTHVALPAAPGALQFRADGKRLFVALPDLGQIGAIEPVEHDSSQLLVRLQVGRGTTSFAPKPDGGEIFTLDAAANTVSIVTAYNDEVALTIPTGAQPSDGLIDPSGSMLFVANKGSDNVSFIDTYTRKTLAAVSAGSGPSRLALSPDGEYLLVANTRSNDVAVLGATTKSLVTIIPAGRCPKDLVVVWQ